MSLIDRINANPLPFAQWLGIEFMSAEADSVAARMLIQPELCTIGATAHGGAIMSFADTLGAAAAFINLPAGAKGRRRSRARPISSPALLSTRP
jgi:1,4-dihydroxy-2-naphthoyl-CoA hydrolase